MMNSRAEIPFSRPSSEARRAASLRTARLLALLILFGAAAAALLGLLWRGGEGPWSSAEPRFLNSWGQVSLLEGRGLYARDSHSGAVQERAQDLITLVFGLPLLAAGMWATRRPGWGGRLLLSGALGYFLYCYGMMAVGTAYNPLFLLYVALFAASLQAFALSLQALDVEAIAASARGFPRRGLAALSLLVALFLCLNWLGGIVLPSLLGARAPAGLESYSTLFVQALDLGVLVPFAGLSAFWLLRRDPRGLVLGTILSVKGAAEGLAVAAMGFSMLAEGIEGSLPLVLGFLGLALLSLFLALRALGSLGLFGREGKTA